MSPWHLAALAAMLVKMAPVSPESLSRADAAWLHAEAPTNHFVVTSLAILDRAPDLERVKAVLRQRIALHPRLRQVAAEPPTPFVSPRWVPAPDFDLDAHVHRVTLRAGKSELAGFIGDLAGQPLDFARPLWSLHTVEGLHGGGALIGRFHHALGDGQAMVRLLLALTDRTADGWRRRAHAARIATAPPNHGRGAIARFVDALPSAGRLARTAVRGAGTLARLTLLDPDRATPLRGRLGLLKAVAWTQPLSLEVARKVAGTSGTTVNDVLVSAIAGGLGAYLRAAGAETKGLRIRAMVPVNLRPAGEVAMAGNRFSLVYLELPVGVADPNERLMRVKIEMDRIKSSLEPAAGWFLVQGLGFLPAPLEQVASSFFATKASLVLTNVIGPGHDLFIAGSRIEQMTFWEPESGGLGVGISIFSYSGWLTVGVISDRRLVAHPERLATGVARAFGDLARHAVR